MDSNDEKRCAGDSGACGRVITTDTVEALKYMKQGRAAYKKSEQQILYNAVFDEATKKYTIYANGEEMTENADWESFFFCDEWEVLQ